jgi:lysophospholipase L1-like esterase
MKVRLAIAVLLGAAVTVLVASPASAAGQATYVALGDSYSAGHGVPPYDPYSNIEAAGPRQDKCHRSKYAFSRELVVRPFIFKRSFFACSGAQTLNVTRDVQWPGEKVVQLGHPELATADLVTVSIGGNDVRFDLVLDECTRLKGNCGSHSAGILNSAKELGDTLVSTYSALRAAVPPTATVIALDYPQLFPAGGVPPSCMPEFGLFARRVQKFLRAAGEVLRATIANAARRAGVHFVDVMPIFRGHEICGLRGGWINHIQLRPMPEHKIPIPPKGIGPGEDSVHPNRAGQAAYASAIARYLRARIAARAPLTPAGLPANPAPAG